MAKTNTLMAQELVQEIEVYKERLVQNHTEHEWLAAALLKLNVRLRGVEVAKER